VRVVLALIAAALAGTAAAQAPPTVPPDAIAIVRDQPVPRADYDRTLAQTRRSYARSNRPFPEEGTPEFERLKHAVVDFLVQRATFEVKARELGLALPDAAVDERIAQIKRQYYGGSERRFQEQLRQQGITIEDVRRDVRAQLVQQWLYARVTAGITVADGEVAAYFRTHRREYTIPASRTVRHILVRSRSLIDRLYARLRAGADFGALARRYSRDPGSKSRGGKLTIRKGQTVQPFDRIAFSLATRRLSKPFRTRFGWHVVQALTPVKPGRAQSFSEVRGRIRATLLQTRRNDAMTSFVEATKRELAAETAYAPGFEPDG
jgi:parvulin-like peptidyl-prolyl isomerase